MKAAVCLILCVLLLEQTYVLSASDDEEDLFASFFPGSKGKSSKGTSTKATAYVSTHEASRITGPGSVSAASKAVVRTGVGSTTSTYSHTESHSSSVKYEPEEPEEETPVKTKGKGKGWKKRKGSRSGKGGEEATPAPKKPAPAKGPPQFDFDALKDKFFGMDDDGDAVY